MVKSISEYKDGLDATLAEITDGLEDITNGNIALNKTNTAVKTKTDVINKWY